MDNNTKYVLGALGIVGLYLYSEKKKKEGLSGSNPLKVGQQSVLVQPKPVVAPTNVYGCKTPTATNFNPNATMEDGSCQFPVVAPTNVYGCKTPTATNFNPNATIDDGSCVLPAVNVYGCKDTRATNFNPNATIDNGSCTFPVVDPIDEVVDPSTNTGASTADGILEPHTPYGTTNYVATPKRDLTTVTRMIPYYIKKWGEGKRSASVFYETMYGYDFNNDGSLKT
jgi:hypothetical protein